jgi:myo-inositol-1(or 4)-monophosphatase
MNELKEVALRAAEAGGRVIRRSFGLPVVGRTKGTGDYVSDVDRQSEEAIRTELLEESGISVVAEESGGVPAERYWVVDPLDGTTNFLHGFPIVGVSIALVEDGEPTTGVVHAPFLDETYVGVRGEGAELLRQGQEPARLVVARRPPDRAVVGTGFPFRSKELLPRYLPVFERCFERFEDLRRPGAAALDLAWVAAGVFDGFFELDLSSWDVAAGALLVQEAGGRVTNWEGGDTWLETGNILAGSPGVHEALVEIATARGPA